MTAPTARCVCPDCGASHRKRSPKPERATPRAGGADTDLDVTRCGRCKAAILSAHIDGLPRRLDPEPVNELGWLTYRGLRRRLFRRQLGGTRAVPVPTVARWPPEATARIHVEHECGKPIPTELQENNIVQKRRAAQFDGEPPY